MLKKIEHVSSGETPHDMRPFRIISLIFLAVGALVSGYAVRLDWILLRSKSWPVVQGEMVSLEHMANSKGVRYTYGYTRDGRQIESSNIMPGLDFHHYPLFSQGGGVPVRHAPGERDYSFITTPDPVLIILPNVIGFCFLIMGGFVTFRLIGRK
jgi:Protein of unknown function (DUF3592)